MDEQPPPDLPNESLPPAPPRRRRGRVVVAGLVAFALLLGGGAAVAFIKMRGSGEQLLSKVPASSDVVFTVYLDPSAGQKANLFLLSSRFPALGSEQQLTTRFQQTLDQALASTGLRHTDLSWVGDQVAFVLDVPASIGAGASPSYAALIDTNDEGAARATIQRLRDSSADPSSGGSWTQSTIDGVDVSSNDQAAYAVFDGTVVVASSLDEMSNIVATAHGHQPALEGSSTLQAATAGLPEGKLALLYVNLTDIVSLLNQVPGLSTSPTSSDLATLQAISSLAMTVSVQPDGVALDAQAVYDPSKLSDEQKAQMNEPGHPNPLLSSIPADALAVVSGEQLDTTLKMLADRLAATSPQAARTLDELGVSGEAGLISSLSGDDAIEVSPGGNAVAPGGALILGTKDPVAMQAALDKLARGLPSLSLWSDSSSSSASGSVSLTRSSSRWVTSDYHGVEISSFRMAGVPDISYAVVDNQGVIGSSSAQVQRVVDAAKGGGNILSSSAYKDAIASVPSSKGSVWVDIQGIVALVRQSLPPDAQAAFDRDAAPNLAPLKAFVVGSDGDATHDHVRIFLKIG